VHTVQDAQRIQDSEFKRKQTSQKRDGSKNQRQEIVPEWMDKPQEDKPPEDPEVVAQRAKKIDEFLNSI
jgi:replication initiation and membrane attachment protein DnaB